MYKTIKNAVAVFAATAVLTTSVYSADVLAANIMTDLTAGAGKKEVSASVYANTRVIKSTTSKSQTKTAGSKEMIVTTGSSSSAALTDDIFGSIGAGAENALSEYKEQESASSEEIVSTADNADLSANSASDNSSADQAEESKYSKYCIYTSEDDLSVRAAADDNSALVGYMYKNSVGEIIDQKNGWTHLRSGELEGWVRNDGLLYGDDAEERISKACMQIAVINTETLRVRSEASLDASINALLGMGDEVSVLDTDEDGWTQVEYEDGTEGTASGYVSNEFITIKTNYKVGETLEEIKDREEKAEASRKAAEEQQEEEKKAEEEKKKDEAEEKAKSEDTKKDNSVSDDTTVSEEAAPSGEAPAEAAKQQEEAKPEQTTTVVNTGATPASANDEMLLAALIQCECNGPYEAQLAVGAVVMNRVKSGYGSISNAIYAPNQFGPASSGKLAATLSSGAISATAMQAAHDAISGISNVGNARYFRNVRSGHDGIVIGNHVYW
ncbi:MAG: SH3 domain-containing protein [Lachnospiraceae bacterium]|nr:SH3 domain-containing protein [Lachnospiraceae bacterium]